MNIEKGKYRLSNITKIVAFRGIGNEMITKTLDTKDGINIEKKCDENSYFVIATIKADKDGYSVFNSVGMRFIEEVDVEDYKIVKELADIAAKIVRLANNER